MSYVDAAEAVLRKHSPGAPLHYRGITQLAIDDGVVAPTGATPEASLNAAITQDIKRREAKGLAQRFKSFGQGRYGLATPADPLGGAIDHHNADVRQRLRDALTVMDPRAFEHLIGQLLESIGFEGVEVTRYSGDGGIDVLATLTVEGVTDVRTAVQVKRWAKKVTAKTVRELRGGLGPHQRGLIITLSDYTPDAKVEASASDRAPISLIAGQRLLSLLIDNGIGVTSRRVAILELDEAALLPPDDVAPEEAPVEGEPEPAAERAPVPREPSRYTGTKGVWTWPLPGGRRAFKSTLDKMLQRVATDAPTVPQAVEWLLANFDRVRSEQVAANYWRVPRAYGLLESDGERLVLTGQGARYLENPTKEALLDILDANVVGFLEIRDYLRSSRRTAEEMRELLCHDLGLTWTTDAQVLWRLHWLETLGVVEPAGDAWRLTT